MSLHHNNQNPAELYVGNTAVSKVYLGNTEVWPNALPPSGDISIVVSRSKLQCAPDSIGFSVDLSSSNFDTPAPANSTSYDRQFHELEYYWTFGDPGNWTAPEKTLPAHKNRNFAYGAFTRHMYRNPGTYTVTVTIVEPASGKTATATTTVTVEDPNTVFPTTRTICVNAIGDNDFTAAPVGAQTFNQNSLVSGDAVHTAIYNSSGAAGQDRVRVLFKSGWSGLVRCDITSMRSVYFDTYGGSGRATFNADTATANSLCIFKNSALPAGDIPELRIKNINFQGDFNETTHRLGVDYMPTTGGLGAHAGMYYMVLDCNFDGFSKQAISIFVVTDAQTNPTGWSMVHLDNIAVTNLGRQYPIFVSGHAGNYTNGAHFTATGCRINKHPDALVEYGNGNASCIRQVCHGFVHVRGCDIYNSDGVWACLRVADGELDGRARLNIHTNTLECAGVQPLQIAGAVANRPAPWSGYATMLNALVEGNILVTGWGGGASTQIRAGGTTMRNNLCIQPNMPKAPYEGSLNFYRYIGFENTGPNTAILNWPSRVFNNTFVCLKTSSNNSNNIPAIYDYGTPASYGFTIANNVLHHPNLAAPSVAYAPLSSEVLFASRNEGWRPYYHQISTTLVSDVVNGGTVVLSYGGPSIYRPASEVGTNHTLTVGGSTRSFTMSYGATEVTITNTSGTTWVSGSVLVLRLHYSLGNYPAKQTAYASGNIQKFAPQPGSPAIDGASGLVAYRSLSSIDTPRGNNPSIGAWE